MPELLVRRMFPRDETHAVVVEFNVAALKRLEAACQKAAFVCAVSVETARGVENDEVLALAEAERQSYETMAYALRSCRLG